MIVLLKNQVFLIFNIKMKQMIEESFPTLKINQHFNFHLEVINTVKNPKQFHSIQQNLTLETKTSSGKSDTLKASQIHYVFLLFHYKFALQSFKQLSFIWQHFLEDLYETLTWHLISFVFTISRFRVCFRSSIMELTQVLKHFQLKKKCTDDRKLRIREPRLHMQLYTVSDENPTFWSTNMLGTVKKKKKKSRNLYHWSYRSLNHYRNG